MSAKQHVAWSVEQRAVFGLVFLVLLFTVTTGAQDNPLMSPPVENSLPPVVSSPTDPSAAPPSAAPKKETEEWEQELLRDPFWPVGYFPPNWQKKTEVQNSADMGGSGWKAAAAKLKISGTSRLGDRTAAIINGELRSEGDKIDALYEGRIYQWEIIGIDASGQIQLKKLGIR